MRYKSQRSHLILSQQAFTSSSPPQRSLRLTASWVAVSVPGRLLNSYHSAKPGNILTCSTTVPCGRERCAYRERWQRDYAPIGPRLSLTQLRSTAVPHAARLCTFSTPDERHCQRRGPSPCNNTRSDLRCIVHTSSSLSGGLTRRPCRYLTAPNLRQTSMHILPPPVETIRAHWIRE